MADTDVRYRPMEEAYNTWTHGLGILLGIVASFFLFRKAAQGEDVVWAYVCISIYLAGMLFSYISSTLYHGWKPGRVKELLRRFDHAAIYCHIAGTYTPFTLLVLRNEGCWGWGVFSFVWLSALFGIASSFLRLKEHSHLETVCYVSMGCSIMMALKPLLSSLSVTGSTNAFWWLVGGGVSYILGAALYSLRKPYMHALFHLFCLGGSVAHIIAIWLIL